MRPRPRQPSLASRGSRCRGRGDCLTMLSINISTWGPTAEAFILSDGAAAFDVVGLLESHLPSAGVDVVKGKFALTGRRSYFSHAALTGRSEGGTSGGVIAAPLSNLALAPRVRGPMGAGGRDWVGVPIRSNGTDILAVYLCLTDSLGPVGVNVCKLREVSAYLMADGRPFVIMADWNMEPAQLRASGFLGLIEAEVLVPRGAVSTCRSGKLLDYAVVSCAIVDAVTVEIWNGSPWRAHNALSISILRAPRKLHKLCMATPRRFGQDAAVIDPTLGWENLLDGEAILTAGRAPCPLGGTALIHMDAEAIELGHQLAAWSAASEKWLYLAHGMDPGAARPPCRGQHPRFILKSIVPRGTIGLGALGELALFWGAVAARVNELLVLRARGRGISQQAGIAAHLAGEAASRCSRLALECTDPHEAFHMKLWGSRLSGITEVPYDVLKGMCTEAIRKADESMRRHRAAVGRRVTEWAHGAVAGSASIAHRYLRAADGIALAQDEADVGGFPVAEHTTILQHKLDTWNALWHRDVADATRLAASLATLRHRALETEAMDCITACQVKGAICKLKVNKGLGADQWAPAELRALPDEAHEGLAALFNNSEVHMVAPAQALLNIITLMPKPLGGDRPTCLATMWYCFWAGIRAVEVHHWEDTFVAFWDDAVRGSSALRAALARRILD